MGACQTAEAATCRATAVVSSGPDTLHACFMVALKVDLYQPKYAKMPITYNVTPCPPGLGLGLGCNAQYGVGTVFNGFNAMGMPENLTITECHYEPLFGKVVFETKGILMTYTAMALVVGGIPNGDCQFTVAMEAPSLHVNSLTMGVSINKHMAMKVDTMKAFIEANTTAICADTPPAGRAVVTATVVVVAPAVSAAVPVVAGVVVSRSARGFVEVPQHHMNKAEKIKIKFNDGWKMEDGNILGW
jgi:hypothetical protein